MDVGVRLQSIRKLKGLSQRELAKRAGVTNSTISMIEKNSVSPSISSLKKVLGGIPMSLMEFFSLDLEAEASAPVVYRAAEQAELSRGLLSMRLIGKDHPDRALTFLSVTYPPGADSGEALLLRDGEEAGILVEGRLELQVGEQRYTLESGDSYYLVAGQPHRFRNPFEAPAQLISAATPAHF
ncbi:Cupin, RmlC-type protein [Azotobacter vinelandii CA]|uniref:Cupin, RmlC-type protein n=2 Tax=Azotobacter vinelandii TaxID=354 RepID=C1DJZ4_AZOVD|nr:cupin domain-containing protein [Azotobacter vinelandii]ACO80899.1 Cupin, RmlC-type protein [Azotobacter vinelandii DJ]AGK15858.1 Cupin, RmlC-type protein [Azotobacter vinelandii CA]AGK22225.1 Cupin, RmlC-type protein [Azotobacter vinelandii CA6]WKN21693.1 cupin domain-containing protein [Azotobacter vinelandii]SFX00634.1 transcriptional regulator, XRE family with cupin sensor [Azotobacter vinelandii]